jgi:hypothetical protein
MERDPQLALRATTPYTAMRRGSGSGKGDWRVGRRSSAEGEVPGRSTFVASFHNNTIERDLQTLCLFGIFVFYLIPAVCVRGCYLRCARDARKTLTPK